MTWLDCRDVGSTLAALAAVLNTTPAELVPALRQYDEPEVATTEDPRVAVPREFFNGFGIDVETVAGTFDGALYFHGTRTFEPEVFRQRGILPLDQIVDELWRHLGALAGDVVTDAEWTDFRSSVAEGDAGGHDGWLYRCKTGNKIHFGPNALLVREPHLSRLAGTHDYLACPEIVQDIARCFLSSHAVDLEQRFCDATKPCIVTFRSTQLRPGAITAAFWYVHSSLREGEVNVNAAYGFDGEGVPVPANDVVEVETF